MIGMALDKKATSDSSVKGKRKKIAGIHFQKKRRASKKTRNVQILNFRTGWDCTVLCLSHSGPRMYAGPL